MSEALIWAAQSFQVDSVTAEAATALEEASIPCILLKGPTIATWLYAHDVPRLYADTDLLIRESDWDAAQDVMRGLAFVDGLGPLEHPRMESGEGYPWKRPADGAEVDLHCTLFGLDATPEQVWDEFFSAAERLPIGGVTVRAPSRPARLLHIALHAVQHGGETEGEPMGALERRPMVDLERALQLAPVELWERTAELAQRLEGTAALAAGLSLTTEGRELAGKLSLPSDSSVLTTLRLQNVPMSEGFAELAQASGLRTKLALILRELFPTAEFMRWWSPLARRGMLGLAAAYLWRPIYLAFRSVPGYLAWRRATRSASGS